MARKGQAQRFQNGALEQWTDVGAEQTLGNTTHGTISAQDKE